LKEKEQTWPWIGEEIIVHKNEETGEEEEWIEGAMIAKFIVKYVITGEAQKHGLMEQVREMNQRRGKEVIVREMVKAILPELQKGQFLPDGTRVYLLKETEGRTLIVSPEEFAELIKEVT